MRGEALLGAVVQVALDGAAGLDGRDREAGARLLELAWCARSAGCT